MFLFDKAPFDFVVIEPAIDFKRFFFSLMLVDTLAA